MNALNVANDSEAKMIGLTIDGHTDQGSNHAFLSSLNQGENNNLYDAKGSIVIKNTQWNKSRNSSIWVTPEHHRIQIDFNNIQIDDADKAKSFKQTIQTQSGLRLQ
jgi:hypothetical protein